VTTASPPTKQRIVLASAELFRRQGAAATGLKQIAEQSGAPFGSIYHHFPGGKEEITETVIAHGGVHFGAIVGAILIAEPDVGDGIRAVFDGAAQTLIDTDYADACPIATIALEVASTNDRLRAATAEVFDGWIGGAAARFAAAGFAPTRACELAMAMVGALEGGFVLARAMRDPEPLRAAGRQLGASVERELAG